MPEEIQEIQNILALLLQIEEDHSIPKNIRLRIKTAIDMLSKDGAPAVNASKALEELEAASDETNLPTYTRTQIWQVVSLLEGGK